MTVDPLRDELLRPPAEGWRPKPGDVLIGEVVGIGERTGFAERPYPVIELETDAGEMVALHAFHTVLRQELAKAAPRIGDRMGVAYHGTVQREDSRYELYKLKVIHAEDDVTELAEPPRPPPADDDIPF